MNAFLETNCHGEWYDDFIYISNYPLQEMGYKVIPFDGSNPNNGINTRHINPKEDICIGSVDCVQDFFKLCDVPTPECISYPPQLSKFLGRTIIKRRFGELYSINLTIHPFFIKPANDIKLFTGDIIISHKNLDTIKQMSNCTDDTLVYISQIINIKSEYRVFVHNKQIRGIKYYKGDFLLFPDVNMIKDMIKSYTNCPIAYTLDVGITSSGYTILVECNDMWSVGSYGLDGKTYALLSVARMKEILDQE